MRNLMTLTAALLAATAVVSSASAESQIGADSGLTATAVQASAVRFWDQGQRSSANGAQAYAAAPMALASGLIVRGGDLPPRKTGVSGGND